MAAKGRFDTFHLARLFWPFFSELRTLFLENLMGSGEVPMVKEGGELVGTLDKAIEERFFRFLNGHFPGIPMVSEEAGGEWPPQSDLTWLIDPLDGSHNHLCGLPMFGSMAALIEGGDVTFSAFFLPMEFALGRSGFYFAGRGAGAWLWNSSSPLKLAVSRERNLSEAFLLLEGRTKTLWGSPAVSPQVLATRRARVNVSMAWAATRLAAGSLFPAGADLVVAVGNKPSDNLPACLLIEEAGGKVSDFSGKPWSVENSQDLLYSNGFLHDQALTLADGG